MADCYDCVHSEFKGHTLKCKRKGTDVGDRASVCSSFVGTDTNVCEDCDYYEFGVFSRWNDHGKCKLTGKKRRDDDVACENFYR